MMTKIMVMDGKTGDQATRQTRGAALRVMGFGGCQLQMTTAGAHYTVAAGRWRLQGGTPGTIIAPIMNTAAEYAIAETTVRHAVAMVNTESRRRAATGHWLLLAAAGRWLLAAGFWLLAAARRLQTRGRRCCRRRCQ